MVGNIFILHSFQVCQLKHFPPLFGHLFNFIVDFLHHLQAYQLITTNPGSFSDASFSSSNGQYVDASYLRLQTIALSYTLPASLLRRAHMNTVTFNINAQNIFVITKYQGIDPEVTNFPAMPPVRTVTAGITCSF